MPEQSFSKQVRCNKFLMKSFISFLQSLLSLSINGCNIAPWKNCSRSQFPSKWWVTQQSVWRASTNEYNTVGCQWLQVMSPHLFRGLTRTVRTFFLNTSNLLKLLYCTIQYVSIHYLFVVLMNISLMLGQSLQSSGKYMNGMLVSKGR